MDKMEYPNLPLLKTEGRGHSSVSYFQTDFIKKLRQVILRTSIGITQMMMITKFAQILSIRADNR